MMTHPKVVIPEAMMKLREEWFFAPSNRIIFSTLVELFEQKKYAGDYRVLANVLRNRNLLEECGGDETIKATFEFTPSWMSFDFYCDGVRKSNLIRQAQRLGTKLSEADSESSLREISEQLTGLLESMAVEEDVSTTGLIMSWREYLVDLSESRNNGIMTGIKCLDDHTCGFQPQDLVIVTAESSHGKTAFGLQIVNHALFELGFPVTVCSFEMGTNRLLSRMSSNKEGISMEEFKRANFSDYNLAKLDRYTMALHALAKSNKIWFYQKRSCSIDSVVSIIRSHKDKYGIKLAMVDYLQLIEVVGKSKNATQAQEIGWVSTKLKSVAEELDIVVVAMAQINDDRKIRGSRQPYMDCDVNIEIVPDVDPKAKPLEESNLDHRNIILHVKKGRNIGEKAFKLRFDRITQSFRARPQYTTNGNGNHDHEQGTEGSTRRGHNVSSDP